MHRGVHERAHAIRAHEFETERNTDWAAVAHSESRLGTILRTELKTAGILAADLAGAERLNMIAKLLQEDKQGQALLKAWKQTRADQKRMAKKRGAEPDASPSLSAAPKKSTSTSADVVVGPAGGPRAAAGRGYVL
jgi:hypothetical protein